jgi:arylsulfate sulfotransferase
MYKLIIFSAILFLFINASASNKINYISPVPGSKMVNVENNIIIGFDRPVSLSENELNSCITVTGTSGKSYPGTVKIIDGNRILYSSGNYFERGDVITAVISGRLAEFAAGKKNYSFSFETSRFKTNLYGGSSIYGEIVPAGKSFENPLITTPPVLPVMTVTTNISPEDGDLFLSNFSTVIQYTPFLIIANKNAVPYAYLQLGSSGLDFKKQPNGNLTYYNSAKRKYYELNSSFGVIDSFYCGYGYSTDEHELRLLPNGHALLMCYDVQIVNMSLIVQGGDTAAHVTGLVLQELDENKNVVFQWRSWDHFAITDAWHENLTMHNIDYVHCNSIEQDNDSNIIISSRHLDEITKINRSNGNIIWRFGGKNNQFSILNDTLNFTYQHAARRISNGNITLFDNGNFRFPQFSRAVEYTLNEQTMTATRVWEYRNTPQTYGMAMGYVQRLPGGNTLISWGSTNPTVTEVNPSGTKVFEMTMAQYMYSYRVFKFPWNGPTVINNGNSSMPEAFRLEQNYPNPFNPTTNISFDIPKESDVNITVYDITGRLVKKLVSGNYNPGKYQITFDGSDYSSGMYFCVLRAGAFFSVQKMALVK